eukprot:1128705-Alexandrium_andersonii.AAC.1
MSASLVGSEMCIRDRNKYMLNFPRGWTLGPELRGRFELVVGSLLQEPVSYTHLTLPTICSV